jgi:predicted transcriptional regulator
LAKIDAIAGEKQKRAAVIETALLEYIAREEAKTPPKDDGEATDKKTGAKSKK